MKHSMFLIAAAFAIAAPVTFAAECPAISLKVSDEASRSITVADQLAVRRVDVLQVSPDQRRYAMLVRQADAANNRYCRSWFVADIRGGEPAFVGDGGDANLALGVNNRYIGGEFDKPAMRWSPDGSALAYTRTRDGEVQVWLSRADGSAQEQLTHNAADVKRLEWSADGQSIYFTVGTPRAELEARILARERGGYHYDTELISFTDFMLPRHEGVEPDKTNSVWVLSLVTRQERIADSNEQRAFELAKEHSGSTDVHLPVEASTVSAFAERADGAQAWAARGDKQRFLSTIGVALRKGARPITCRASQCTGWIPHLWWRKDGTVVFLRAEGVEYSSWSLYAWSPKSEAVSALMHITDDVLTNCQQTANDTLLCVRETPSQPIHIAAIDIKSGSMSIAADVNPAFRHIRLGAVERFEWDTPKFAWNAPGGPLEGAYEPRAFGYILYPPDFTSARKYPVFISPYAASGFDNISNFEYPLHALAAQGFVVLSTNFPMPALDAELRAGPDFSKQIESVELGFPHLSMHMESTLAALDVAVARGFIDESRVGIGGVSQGSLVPLFTMIKHDRFAALALSGGGWDPLEYYFLAKQGRAGMHGGYDFLPKPDAAGWNFWQQRSIAENVGAIEAPILFNATAAEMYTLIRLTRHMDEAGKPYDAYVYPRETHIKFQPAHLDSIMRRNVDWLRFWLQSYEDSAPEKAVQYERWRKLRELQQAQRVSNASGG
jgi:dipeptidyl aminopeptidase/acylaminoacyl peptidase